MTRLIFFSFSIGILCSFMSLNLTAADESTKNGFLTVNTVPEGLNVYVDGKVAGKTPLKMFSVSSGSRIISIEVEPCFKSILFYSWNKTVFVEPEKSTVINILLEPVLTHLKVDELEISGVKIQGNPVYVDGKNVGILPGDFEVPVCSKLLEITDKNSRKVIYSSELDLLKGKIMQRSEKGYEIAETDNMETGEKKAVIFQQPENAGEKFEFKAPENNSVSVVGPYKWYGAGLIIGGALITGLGGYFDYRSFKEYEKYTKMGSEEEIRKEIEAGGFSVDDYINKRDGHFSKGKDYSTARTVLYVVGGASLLTGIVLLFVPEKKDVAKSASFLVIPSPNGLNISAEISF